MALDQRKYEHKHAAILRDVRPLWMRIADAFAKPSNSSAFFMTMAGGIIMNSWFLAFADLLMVFMGLYLWWLTGRDRSLAFKMPMGARFMDKNNGREGKPGKPEGILFLGNVDKTNEEVWFTNSDIRTHFLYLGTTGAGKTEGLKSMVTNAMTWGSGFVYVDGKADTDLWSSLSSLVRRFGRDDDLLVLNYMTGNSDVKAPSNSMNPFSSGSASYLTNMLVSLMPESEGDNAMWKERAVSLVGAMMPILTWKRDNQDMPLSVRTIRDHLALSHVIKLSRDEAVPIEIRVGVKGYLDTLPGYVDAAFGDDGKQKPPGPDVPQYDTTTANQQHGYLAMQFTRSLQSLGDDYGYIFDTQAADVDMVDIVLNRRILIVLIPALEKSGDEVANLGKIVAATMKGMMGSTLGSTVEGTSASVIENKPTHSSTPFMTVFDEVGYYTAAGMAVMAAQARSLGFSLVFSGQDIPAMKKRVREEANSILANCNIKIFGKLEDPTDTKDFFEKTVGTAIVTEVSGFQLSGGMDTGSYRDTKQAGVQLRPRASYDGLRGFKEGQAVVTYGERVVDTKIFYSNPGFAKAMRVTRYMALPPPDDNMLKHANAITKLRDKMVNKSWTATNTEVAVATPPEINALIEGYRIAERAETKADAGITALVGVYGLDHNLKDLPPPPVTAAKPAVATPASPLATKPGMASAPPSQPAGVSPLAKKPDSAAVTPPPAAPPAQTTQAQSTGPMGFFGNAPAASTPAAAPAAQPPATPPASPPVPAPAATTTPAPAQTAPVAKKSYKLPPEIENALKVAGQDAGRALFKGKKDDIDAAE